jgi:hypothetical protein
MGLRRAAFTIFVLGVCWRTADPASRARSSAQKKGSQAPPAAWNFVVSGDSRNCGNVVMPAIAADARLNHAEFYWHLGDLRMIQRPDEDYLHEPEHRPEVKNELILLANYEKNSWKDFIHEQIVPFRNMPFYVGIGNHELITPKTRQEFIQTFRPWLDQPALRQQRLADDPNDTNPKTYFHWKEAGIEFIYLDNASLDQFSALQMQWFEGILQRDESDPTIKTIVAAMHESLPDSLADQHSMSDSEVGKRTGRQAYADLVEAEIKGKKVYVLASHSHYYMDGAFNSEYLRSRGKLLPGWIIGTGGAYRYKLPEHASEAKEAKAAIYGYLLATVSPAGEITFSFKQLEESDIPKATMNRYTPRFVHWCFVKNHE